MAVRQTLQADGELHIRGANDILHLEVLKARIVAQLCDNLAILRDGKQGLQSLAAGLLSHMHSLKLRFPGDHACLRAVRIMIERAG